MVIIIIVVIILLIFVSAVVGYKVMQNIDLAEKERAELIRIDAINARVIAQNKELERQYNEELSAYKNRVYKLSNINYTKGGVDCPRNTIDSLLLDTADSCIKACDDNDSCVASVWNNDNKSCHLKDKISDCMRANTTLITQDAHAYDAEEARIILEEKKAIDEAYKLKLNETEAEQQRLYDKYKEIATQIKSAEHTKDGIDCSGSMNSISDVENAYECLNICKSKVGCKGIIYGKDTKKCYPMREFNNCTKNDEYVASFNSPSNDWDPHFKRFQDEYNARNNRLVNPELTKVGIDCSGSISSHDGLSKNACVEKCDKTKGCVAVAIDNGKCWLMSKLSNCKLSPGTIISMKDPATFAAEKERLANTLLPAEQERKELIDSCNNLNIPNTPKSEWSQDILNSYNKCENAGILKTL